MKLKDLYQEMPYKWRVQSFSEYKPQASCVAYIDARDVQQRLDDVCGQENWQAIYYEVGSMLFCKIGIKVGDEWVWKSDTGSESNIEKEKGHSSDAFKRAGVLWGIGRFLYSLKVQYVDANEAKTKNPKNWPYVINNNGKRVWDLTKFINDANRVKPNPRATPTPNEESYLSKMAGFAKFNEKTYWSLMGVNGYTNAREVPEKEQHNLVAKIEAEIKGKN